MDVALMLVHLIDPEGFLDVIIWIGASWMVYIVIKSDLERIALVSLIPSLSLRHDISVEAALRELHEIQGVSHDEFEEWRRRFPDG